MGSLGIVIVDPFADFASCLTTCLEGMEVDALIFERPPEPFYHAVINPSPLAIYGDFDLGIVQNINPFGAGELASLVAFKYLGLAVFHHDFLQGFDAEARLHGIRQPPAQDFSTIPVHDGDETQKPMAHRDIGIGCL